MEFQGNVIRHHEEGRTTVIPNGEFASLAQGDNQTEIFLSDYIMDGVQFYPLWGMTVTYEDKGISYRLSPQVFPSAYQGNQEFSLSRCIVEEDGKSTDLRWIVGNSPDGDLEGSIESLYSKIHINLPTLTRDFDQVSLVSGKFTEDIESYLNRLGFVALNLKTGAQLKTVVLTKLGFTLRF